MQHPFCAACPSGCSVDEGGAFNARIQWRKKCNGDGGGFSTYLYYPGRISECGDDWFWGNGAEPSGEWQEIKMYLRLNDLGVHCIVALQSLPRQNISCGSEKHFFSEADLMAGGAAFGSVHLLCVSTPFASGHVFKSFASMQIAGLLTTAGSDPSKQKQTAIQ
jgi:hypothetical protein